MKKTILLTGATDGIGLEAAKLLAADGHKVLLHGRSEAKLKAAADAIGGDTQSYIADFTRLDDVRAMADRILEDHQQVDVLINNAGVLKLPEPVLPSGMDARFIVNMLAPYVLTTRLLGIIPSDGRILNLSSAAQAPVNLDALAGKTRLDDMGAYSQSKLAITMWSFELAKQLDGGPTVLAVNPGSLLGSKMVKEGFGIDGKDLGIGAKLLYGLSVSDDFKGRTGEYFDNDAGRFGNPHPDALDATKSARVVEAISSLVG